VLAGQKLLQHTGLLSILGRHAIQFALLLHVIEGDVRGVVFGAAKDADLAHLFRRDAAGGDVGDGTRLERQPRVRDVNRWSQHGHTDGVQIVDMTANERTDEIDVVNHEIQHDGHISAARVERGKPVALDEARCINERKRAANGAIEPLDVPRLNQCAGAFGDSEQIVGLVQCRGDRLLNHHVDAALERRLRDRVMADRGDDNRDGLDLIEQSPQRGDCRNAQLRAHLPRAIRTDLMEADQPRAIHITQQPNVMLAETPRADDPDVHVAQITTPR
jgi:hypothetical protein